MSYTLFRFDALQIILANASWYHKAFLSGLRIVSVVFYNYNRIYLLLLCTREYMVDTSIAYHFSYDCSGDEKTFQYKTNKRKKHYISHMFTECIIFLHFALYFSRSSVFYKIFSFQISRFPFTKLLSFS